MSQPVDVYPNTVTRQPSPHSNGSFGTVFIVLAVIVVISAIACFLGRLCSRRYHHSKAKQNPTFRPKEGEAKQSHKTFRPKEGQARQNHPAFHPKEGEARQNHTAFHPKEGEARQKNHTACHPRDEEIEFGFDVGIPTAKMAGNGKSKGPKLSENGDQFKEVRFANDDICSSYFVNSFCEARQNHSAFHPKEGEARQNHTAFHTKEGEARQKNHTAFHPGDEDIEFGV